jgi:hypothetical protein
MQKPVGAGLAGVLSRVFNQKISRLKLLDHLQPQFWVLGSVRSKSNAKAL